MRRPRQRLGPVAGQEAQLAVAPDAETLQNPAHLAGHGGGGVQQLHLWPRQALDERRQEGVVGAAQGDDVGALGQERLQGLAQQRLGGWAVEVALLDLLHQARTGLAEDAHAPGVALDDVGEEAAAQRGRGGEHAHGAALGECRRGLDGGHHADKGHAWELGAQVIQRRSRGGVAGYNDAARPALDEVAADLLAEAADLGDRPGAVGAVDAVGQLEGVAAGQLAHDLTQHGQAAYAGIEEADAAG